MNDHEIEKLAERISTLEPDEVNALLRRMPPSKVMGIGYRIGFGRAVAVMYPYIDDVGAAVTALETALH